ncbi:MAG: VCBS repeat-containing protein [Verrucomicrobia bacterium]|nr:VCBS repeat-containing protein [Verrucomicrobiota bacterium]
MLKLSKFWLRPGPLMLAGATLPLVLASDTASRFGFTGPEIFPIDNLVSHLRSADLDGDGLRDLIVVNNARSRINLLFNQTGRTNETAQPRVKKELNELPPDARFRIESIASEKRISALAVADFNGDGRPDLAYFGEPRELVVQFNQGTNSWSTPRRFAIEDGQLDMNALAEGDLNGDGLEDLVLLGENSLHFLAQRPDHTLADPERIPYTGKVKAVQILDINGDGRQDLLLVNWEDANPFRLRLQGATGQLGPEVHFPLASIRSYWCDDLDGDKRTEVVTISQKSGRAQISNFVQKPAEALAGDFLQGQFHIMPLNRTTKNRRATVWADVNQDRRPDLLVAEPESGQLTLMLQQADGSFAAPRTFPSFTGVAELAVADWDGDGAPELFLLSLDERQVGVTRLDSNGRIAFPTLLPLEGRPLSLAAGVLRAGEPPALAVILDADGKREVVVRRADGRTTRQRLAESFKGNPTGLMIHDANADGLADLAVLIPYDKIKLLLQQPDSQPFQEVDVAPPGGSAEQPWATTADVDGDGQDELLLAQKNFVRAVVLQADPVPEGSTNRPGWSFRVKEQINGAGSNSRIVAAALVKDAHGDSNLFLLDAERKGLTLCRRDATGVWQVVKTINLPVTDFNAIQPIVLGAPDAPALGFVGLNTAAWLPFGGLVWSLEELDYYETPIKGGFLHDVVSGDLNGDGRRDLVFLETGKNYLDIVTFEAPAKLVPANRWQVFEERTFRGRRNDIPEPREAFIGDFTGDGRSDLAVLVHDRILLYPQE